MKKVKIAQNWALKSIAFLLINLLLLAGTAAAQEFPKAKLDALLDTLAAQNKAMGSLALIKDGKVLYAKAIGDRYRMNSENIPADIKTKYRIASITKTFTSTMIFQLIEEGKISLSTTLDQYFPKVPHSENITISHMLSHKSGIHDFTQNEGMPDWVNKIQTSSEMADIISKYRPDFLPGERFEYSNSNYVLLGYIIEKIDGASYSKCLNKRITSKLGLKDTFLGEGKPKQKNNESFSYKFNHDWQHEPEVDLTRPAGAGGIVSTPTDLGKFMDALFGLKLISKSSLSQMLPTAGDHYGMGMHEIHFELTKGLGHGGAIDASRSLLTYFPEDSLTVAYCTNGELYQMEVMINLVLKIYHGQPYKIPVRKSEIKLNERILQRYVGVYEIRPNFQLSVKLDEGRLIVEAHGRTTKLFAKTENAFFVKTDEVEIEFIVNEKGIVDTLLLIDGTIKMLGKRVN